MSTKQKVTWSLVGLAVAAVAVYVWAGTNGLICLSTLLVLIVVSLAKAKTSSTQQARLVCPHCHAQGTVTTNAVSQKRGVSGGKATAAILTGGVSLLATGLSRKEQVTEAHCSHCGSTWHY